ncbi:MAG: ethanolamine utilization protein EutH [Tessaracoccus sp.]|uniref:ethanolamine utilization protein EutH n=1 Tax=Tessaracoccus sp. TaxID=1971211 RepID=UPI001EC406F3|nr:ethanolamine utilization protein EutH [Tessaracoccus sp.]MBK7821071.1 ethanolamine utilization protein EutH [Tessaracoccus sp.]
MGINDIIVWILMICMVLGGLDRAIGNKFGLGEKFEEGFNAMGPLALSMVGVYALSPVLAKVLGPIVKPVYELFGADPAMFAGTLLANDMGGWPLAQAMTDNPDAQRLSGLILGAMMGATVVFTIPVALGIIDKSDRPFLAKGVLAGIVTIPIGVIVSGAAAGMPMGFVFVNVIPIILTAALIAFGLWRAPDAMTKGFMAFGKGLVFVISIGLVIGVFETVTKVRIMPEGWELLPVEDGIAIVGSIAMMLLGAFPAVHLIVTFGAKPLSALGKLVGINKSAAGGLIATLANNIAMFEIFKNMDRRGKILNAAFAVAAAFALGDHLGFTAGVAPDMIAPMIAGKLVAGITAVALAYLLFAKSNPAVSADEEAAEDAAAGSEG